MSSHPQHNARSHAPRILALPAFNDNYIWLITDGRSAVVVDPGTDEPVVAALREQGLALEAILLTHHHSDHIGGVEALLTRATQAEFACPKAGIRVIGPDDARIPQVTERVEHGSQFTLLQGQYALRTLSVPGHTETHIAYVADDALFCGDTLFSAGCGRLFGGTAAQLHASLQSLAALPADLKVYCTHEYTLSNLRFAQAVEPNNPARDAWLAECQTLRARGEPTLPTTVGRELQINPFLRPDQAAIRAQVAAQFGTLPTDDLACFTALRQWKDQF